MSTTQIGDKEIIVKDYRMVGVEPKHYKERRNNSYVDEYSFAKAHIDDMDVDWFCDGVYTCRSDLGLWYMYESNDPILITEDRIYRSIETDAQQAERDAYFALSQMDSNGCVTLLQKR